MPLLRGASEAGWFVLALTGVLILAGCGSATDPTPAPSGSPSGSLSGSVAPGAIAPAASARGAPGSSDAAVAIDPPAAAGSLAPNLHASGEDVLGTWIEAGAAGARRLRFSRLRDGRWSAPTTIVENAKLVANWADVPGVAAGEDGVLVASWAESSGPEGHTYDAIVARSSDAGATWQRVGRLHADATRAEHGFVTLLPDAGAVRAFWLDGREAERPGGTTQIRTALVGAAVEGEAVVDPGVCDCCQTTGAATSAGPVVAYRDRTASELRDIGFARREGGAWKTGAVAADGWIIAGCPVNGPSMAWRDGLLAVGWYTYAESTHRVRVAFSRDRGESFGAAIEVDGPTGTRAPVGRASTVVDGDTAIVGWMASDRDAATVLLRRVGADGSRGPEVILGTTLSGRDAGFPRLARTTRDLVAAWTEPGPTSRIRAVRVSLGAIPQLSKHAPEHAPAVTARRAGVGDTAPEIEAQTLDGKPAALSALRGQVVLINVWATWCEPCRHEMPALSSLHTRDAARGFTVIGVNVDREPQANAVAAFVARRKLTFPVWRDVSDVAPAALAVTTYPANILIGRDGTIRWRRDGAIRADDPELRRAIDEALAAPR